MTAGRWQRIKDILVAVDELSPEDRNAALADLCGDDSELRREIDSLLAQEDRIAVLNEPADRLSYITPEPQHAGPYRIERLLGAGGMGAVYLGARCDDLFDKHVAIKVIQSLRGTHLERRFQTERRILAELEHPTIARLLDGGALEDGRPFLVMEYVDGERIDKYVDSRAFGVDDTLALFLKVCGGVQYAHQRLIVHRDLKPSNILVTADCEPRLLDFGIAKMLRGAVDADATGPFESLLTPSSASPEQVAGGAITTASDVYALGLLLYRLLTGRSAYADARNFKADPSAVILKYDPPRASRAPEMDPQRAKALRGDLDLILARALEKDASRRYQTVEELAAEIRRYLERRPIRARVNSHLYVARRFARRNRLAVGAAALLLLSITAGVAGTLVYARRAQRQKEIALRRLDTLRRISESFLFEFHDSIKDLPGSTEARALVVRRALQYLDQVAAEESTDPAVQRDLAAGYVRIGLILSAERGAHLGGPDAMRKAMQGYERALAIRRRLVAAHPADPALRTELLESLWTVAYGREAQGDIEGAIQLLHERLQAVDESPQHGSFSMRYSQASTYSALSDMYRSTGENGRALLFAQQSLEERTRLLADNPGNKRAKRAVGLSYDLLGYALAAEKKYPDAARNFEKAAAVFAALAAASASSTDLQRNVQVSEMDLCEMLARSQKPGEAMPHCRRAVALASAMRIADPENVQSGEDLAAAYATTAFALHLAGKPHVARTTANLAVAEFQKSLTRDPDTVDTQTGYADVLVELAGIEHELHDRSSCAHLSTARQVLSKLARSQPKDATIQSRLLATKKLTLCR